MDQKMPPGKTLRTLREIKKLTQAKLGEMAGLPVARISDFEKGQRTISKSMVKKPAGIFGTSPAVFI